MSDYSSNFPQQRPVFAFNADAGKLDSRVSFSRADTPPTYAAPSAVHYWSNEKHLSSENLLLQSQDFDTTWANDGSVGIASVTGSQTAPDGTSTAWLVTANTFTGGAARLQQSNSISTNTEYSMIAHVKAGTASHAYISFRGASSQSCSVTLNFSTQALTNTAFNFTSVSSTVTALGNSWFKLTLTGTTNSSTASRVARIGISDGSAVASDGNPSWNASGETMYAWGAQLSSVNSLVYDSPTTTQISRSYSSTLKSVTNAGDPRFEYDPTDGQSVGTAKGLLVESQSSNLFARSSGFDYTAAWTKTNVTATAEAISPDGTLNAFAIRENEGGGTKRMADAVTVAAGSVAVSVYAKILGNERRLVIREDSTTGDSAVFDLSSGTVAATNVGGAGTIESVGGGFYRCTLITSPGSGSKAFGFWLASATGTNYETYTGDGYSGVLLFGAQCENASASSSYIESLGSSGVTRASDSCTVATSSFGYTGGPVSVIAEASMTSPTTETSQKSVFELGDGTSDNRIWVYNNFGKADSLYVRADGVTGMFESGTVATDDDFTVAVRVDTNNAGRSTNGGSVTSDTSVVMPSGLDTLYVGRSKSSSGNQLNGHFKRLSLFNVALSDTELKSLTS